MAQSRGFRGMDVDTGKMSRGSNDSLLLEGSQSSAITFHCLQTCETSLVLPLRRACDAKNTDKCTFHASYIKNKK